MSDATSYSQADMSEGKFWLPEGLYRTEAIGGESPIQSAETKLEVDARGVISVNSPLYEDAYRIGDASTFVDPRVDKFLQVATFHQFHHFTTRQLSVVEEFETRPGASRFVRLGGLLDVARMLNDLGGTFEQVVQGVISDFAHPAGSHLRGDFMVGDYINQDTHDGDLWSYITRSGFKQALEDAELLDDEGYLVGSPTTLEALADPRTPRHHDIVECPRPDGNVDRNQFTLHEGAVTHDLALIREARSAIVRVETKDGERMAMNSPDAARLLYILGARHQSESWAEPLHRLVEELVLLSDRYAFSAQPELARSLNEWYPVDYARTDEQTWHKTIQEMSFSDPFIAAPLKIAAAIARHQRELALEYVGNDHAYTGPQPPEGMKIEEGSARLRTNISVSDSGELWIALPEPKYRGPVDSLVVTSRGLKRISEIDPSLRSYADSRRRWIVPLLAKISLPRGIAGELAGGIRLVDSRWSATKKKVANSPVVRPPMPAHILEDQINQARQSTISASRVNQF